MSIGVSTALAGVAGASAVDEQHNYQRGRLSWPPLFMFRRFAAILIRVVQWPDSTGGLGAGRNPVSTGVGNDGVAN